MIWGLRGTLIAHNVTSVVILVGGVYYEVRVTALNDVTIGHEIFLYTHQVIREDEHYLVGFPSESEKELFLQLINVNGIGPKTALGILTATTPERFKMAIADEDLVYLKKLPGVGPKGASQIILDLKGKLETNTNKGASPFTTEVAAALASLGFKKAEVSKILAKLGASAKSANELLKDALVELRK